MFGKHRLVYIVFHAIYHVANEGVINVRRTTPIFFLFFKGKEGAIKKMIYHIKFTPPPYPFFGNSCLSNTLEKNKKVLLTLYFCTQNENNKKKL